MTIDALRDRCAALQYELSVEYYRAGAGLQEQLDTTSIFDRYAELTDLSHLAATTAAFRAAADPVEQRVLALLRDQLGWIYDAHAGRELTDRLQQEEALAEVEVDGRAIAYRALPSELMNEPDRARRLRLAAARDEVLDRLEPLHLESFALAQRVARDLSYPTHVARCADLGELPIETLRPQMQRLLDATDDLYHAALGQALSAAGIAPDTAHWSDLSHLFRVTAFDSSFTAAALVPRVTAMIAAMGLDIRAGGHVSFDLEDRPLKSPRPFCSVLRAPTEVVLVLRPVGGLTDYAAFLHELGHALHFGHVDPSLPWEFRHLGDNSITEGFAFVFDRLSVDATWLREVIGLTEPQGLARTLALRELMMSRKYAAQFLWELDLFSDDEPQARRASWAEAIGRATGVQQSPANYLGSVDPVFYCARYLQGWLFEAVLSERLRADLGPAWFHEPAAGERLLALYRRGQDRPVAALFGELDAAPLTIEPLLQRAARELG